jgi:hypothetical protein
MTATATLPTTASALIRLAVDDLEKCENADGYRIDMDTWHRWDAEEKECAVCLSGSVLAQTLGQSPETDSDFGSGAQAAAADQLDALDDIRRGNVLKALQTLKQPATAIELTGTTIAPRPECTWLAANDYAADPDAFKANLRALADLLEKVGA